MKKTDIVKNVCFEGFAEAIVHDEQNDGFIEQGEIAAIFAGSASKIFIKGKSDYNGEQYFYYQTNNASPKIKTSGCLLKMESKLSRIITRPSTSSASLA